MHTELDLVVLMMAVGGAWLAAAFAALAHFRAKPAPQLLTAQGAAQLLRAESISWPHSELSAKFLSKLPKTIAMLGGREPHPASCQAQPSGTRIPMGLLKSLSIRAGGSYHRTL